jgi:hypothetical protein
MVSASSYDITELFRQIWVKEFWESEEDICKIRVEFYPYTTLKNTIRKRGTTIFIRISDMILDAPKDVLVALGVILFCKLKNKRAPKGEERLYKNHVNSEQVKERVRKLRQNRGKKVYSGPKGEFYCLEESFNRINMRYFKGELEMPNLTWSRRRTTMRFGHHDEALNTIVISRTLDDGTLPRYLLDYIMYHEALHMKHPLRYENGRRRVHSKDFLKDEKRFAEYEKAEALLKKVSRGPSRKD